MKYALNLSSDNRILSACVIFPTTPTNMPCVDTLPEGNINDWLYVNNEYVYDPLPEPEPIAEEPTQLNRIEAQTMYTALMTDTLLEE